MKDLIQEVLAVLTTTAERWRSLTQTLSAAALTQTPAPGEWSAAECLDHMIQLERDVFPTRVQNMLAGKDIAGVNPVVDADYTQLNIADLGAEFARLRAQNIETIKTLQPADLERTAMHSQLGLVTLGQVLNAWAAHDLNHTMQAERALMQPFIAGCGAFRVRYEEHVLPKR